MLLTFYKTSSFTCAPVSTVAEAHPLFGTQFIEVPTEQAARKHTTHKLQCFLRTADNKNPSRRAHPLFQFAGIVILKDTCHEEYSRESLQGSNSIYFVTQTTGSSPIYFGTQATDRPSKLPHLCTTHCAVCLDSVSFSLLSKVLIIKLN